MEWHSIFLITVTPKMRFFEYISDGSLGLDSRINNGPKITIDGFPRQGNRYLRRKVWENLPGACIPFELTHSVDIIELAFLEDHHVILTIRDPIDCISSFISMSLDSSLTRDEPLFVQRLAKTIYARDDIADIERIFNYYNELGEQILSHSKVALIVPFKSIVEDIDNKLIKKIINRISYSEDFADNRLVFLNNSTKNIKLSEYLNDKKFFKLVEKANHIHDKINSLNNLI
jgi:hypothetical protein